MNIAAARKAMGAGDLGSAQKHLVNALKDQPENPELHYNLAMVSARLGDFSTASEHFLFCLKQAPDNVELLCNAGNALRLSGKVPEARKHLDKALQCAPGHIASLCNRGWLNLKTGQYQPAVKDFEAALKQNVEIEDAWKGLAESQIAAQRLSDAQGALNTALSRFPSSSTLHNIQGVLYNKCRKPDKAVEHFRRAIKLTPGNADAQLNLGITGEQIGAFDEAESSLLAAINLRPGHPSTLFHLAHLAAHKATPEEITAIERALELHPHGISRVDLLFALGKTQAKLGRHDEAFPNFIEARRHLSQLEPYDVHKALLELQKIAAKHQNLDSVAEEARYVFVVGMPRSGTTLTDQILASHSEVHALGESGAVGAMLSEYSELRNCIFSSGLKALPTEKRERYSKELIRRLSKASSARIIVDTSPGNFPYIGLLAELLPNSRFVHCSRHPLDTCVSILEHPLTKSHGYANSLTDLGHYYRGYEALMNHWESLLGRRIYTVTYEKLLENPEPEIQALLNHCSLEFEEQCVQFYDTNRPVLTPSASQVRKPLTQASVGRWKVHENFLSPLMDALRER